eukprot:GHRR01021195.1.p1 GENE.GHRR01021195.1~~GHRR01021195.1.p1  ORF type:complete len:511 (+),score=207.14 GHRR01021195.1:167-1699(+)
MWWRFCLKLQHSMDLFVYSNKCLLHPYRLVCSWCLHLLASCQDCLAMGAIFAATDSVATLQVLDRTTQPALFSLVFGEGVVNDAVSVVLLGAVANTAKANAAAAAGAMAEPRHGSWAGGVVANFVWLLVTSWALGSAAGFGITATLKKLHLSGAHQELAVITLLSYLSYLLADVLGLSGILSLFVCGVIVSHYAFHNVSEEGRNVTMVAFKTASYLAEGIIFIYVGMDALDPLKWKGANAAEVVWLMLLLTALLAAARAAFVIPFSIIHNIWSHEKLRTREIVVVWWAGLMRGAVSVALVYYYFDDNPREMPDRARATLIVSTLMVVMLSILGFGAFTKPLLAAMLKGDRDMPLMDQLRAIPLLSNFTRETSSASLLIERVDNTFRQQHQQPLFGVSAANTPRQQSSNGSTGRSGDSAPGSGGYYRGMLGMQQDGGSTREMTKDGSSGADATAAVAQAPAAVLPIAPVAAAGSTGGFIGFDIDDAAIAAAGAGEPLIPGDEFSALPHGQQ